MNSLNWKENPTKMKAKAINDSKYKGVGQLKPEIIISRFNVTRLLFLDRQIELIILL